MITFIGTLFVLAAIGLGVANIAAKALHDKGTAEAKRQGRLIGNTDVEYPEYQRHSAARPAIALLALVGTGAILFKQMYFYAEPGFIYHVRTISGEERVVSNVGWELYNFGRRNAWKRAITVQATDDHVGVAGVDAESNSSTASVNLPPLEIVFLDQVNGNVEATTRFTLPTDTETFLKMAHAYRTPENLIRTALIPAFKETLQANAGIMTAEDYFSGQRTAFNLAFSDQMESGIYLVDRKEKFIPDAVPTTGSANSATGEDQEAFGDGGKVVFEVEKRVDARGLALREPQNFSMYGISVVDTRITELVPNQKFIQRMELKQQASADRAIAKEKRTQEVEERLLAVAKGDREVATRQAAAKVDQIARTTAADTEKQLAITRAELRQEQAAIDKEAAQILLEKAEIDAKAVKVAAEAEAFRKKAVMTADNALAQKLAAEIQIQKVWAQAYSQRRVPQYVFGGSGSTPTGGDGEVSTFMQLMTADAAKRLAYDRGVSK